MTRFSVIIPTYNRAHIIGETLDSILCQSFRDFEIFVIDDGSTDDTSKVLERYSGRIRYLWQPNSGPIVARNRGIAESTGEYIAFLDSDDRWYPGKLEQINKAIRVHPKAGLFYSDFRMVDKQHKHLRTIHCRHIVGNGYFQLLLGDFIGMLTAVVRRECFDACGPLCEELCSTDDWDMWVRIARKFSIVHVPAVLAEYTWHSSGSVSSDSATMDKRKVIDRALEADPNLSRSQHREIEARLSQLEGVRYIQQGNKEMALSCFSKSMRLSPFRFQSFVYWMLLKTGSIDWLPGNVKCRLWIM
jgi:glycosyltransferase involved in cell wall biosynthesis